MTEVERRTVTLGPGAPNRWAVLAGAWGGYAAFGMLVSSIGALVPEIQADLQLTDGEMGLVLGAWQMTFIVAAVPAGWFIGRFGIRLALLVALALMIVAGLGRAAAGGFGQLLAAVALHGVGSPMISVGAPTVAAGLFAGADRRLAVGIYTTAPTVGAVLGLLVPGSVVMPLTGGGWRTSMLVLTALAGVALVVWAVVSRGLGPDNRTTRPPEATTLPGLAQYRELIRLPVVRFVLVLSIAAFFFIHGIGQWAVAILTESGWTAGQAGIWAAVGTGGGLVASLTLARLATPALRPPILVAALLSAGLAIQFLPTGVGLVLAPAILVIFMARSALAPLLIMTLMDHPDIGPARTAAATGLFFTTAQVGGVVGPATTGLVAQLTDGFTVVLIGHSIILAGAAVAVGVGRRLQLI